MAERRDVSRTGVLDSQERGMETNCREDFGREVPRKVGVRLASGWSHLPRGARHDARLKR